MKKCVLIVTPKIGGGGFDFAWDPEPPSDAPKWVGILRPLADAPSASAWPQKQLEPEATE